ncbi:MAG: STAS/SEC14 domain-containing protein [Actinobacteria bacterium]|nr:STAS/SEC14 domain-containing protein [Actinomycetota bacterium]
MELLDETTDTCVVVRFGGKVTGDEYKVFLDAIDDRLKESEKVDMVAELTEFTFYGDLEAFKEDAHFGTHEYRKVGRAAFVGDSKWIKVFIELSRPFYKAEEKQFASGALDEAVAWACQGS